MKTDTPETDALDASLEAQTWAVAYCNMRDHARKLELKSEELLEFLESMQPGKAFTPAEWTLKAAELLARLKL